MLFYEKQALIGPLLIAYVLDLLVLVFGAYPVGQNHAVQYGYVRSELDRLVAEATVRSNRSFFTVTNDLLHACLFHVTYRS